MLFEHKDPAIRRRVKLWRDKAAGAGYFKATNSNLVGDIVAILFRQPPDPVPPKRDDVKINI